MTKYVCEKCGTEKDAEEAPQCCGADMKKNEETSEHTEEKSEGGGCC